ncbi:hypothetical protein GCM10020254_79280 [Streptomyces goshikiensis]
MKDPSYPDTMYVSQLVIAGTVNTMPSATLAAFADHGTLPVHLLTAADYAAADAHLKAERAEKQLVLLEELRIAASLRLSVIRAPGGAPAHAGRSAVPRLPLPRQTTESDS